MENLLLFWEQREFCVAKPNKRVQSKIQKKEVPYGTYFSTIIAA